MNGPLGKIDKEVVRRCLNNSIHRRILCNLNHMGVASAEELFERDAGVSLPSLHRALDTLEGEGMVYEVKKDKKRPNSTSYSLSAEFEDFIQTVMTEKEMDTYLLLVGWKLQNVYTDFHEYLSKKDNDIHKDLAGIGSLDICISDEDLIEFHKKMFELLKAQVKPETEGCKKRTITISIGPPRA